MGLEAQCSAVELADLLPAQERRLFVVIPRESRRAVDHAGRQENRGAEAESFEYGQRVLADITEAVVEIERDDGLRGDAPLEQPHRGREVDDLVPLAGEQLHLLAETARRDGQRVVVVRDPVVEEDPQPAPVGPAAASYEPPGRPNVRDPGLDGSRERRADARNRALPRPDSG